MLEGAGHARDFGGPGPGLFGCLAPRRRDRRDVFDDRACRRESEPEQCRPVEGLDLVAPFFASAEEAREWLVAPNRMTDGKPPIEALRDGNVPAVRDAAAGAFDYA
jgi:uncharacterized protein (DUF2384 family)